MLARPVGACARPPLGRLPPPVRLAAVRAAARSGSGGLRSPGWLRSPLGCSGLAALRPPRRCGLPLPSLGGSASAGAPPPPPRWGCAALALAAPAGGPLAGLRPASSGPRPPGVGGVGLAACGRRWLLSQQSALRRCGIQSGVALLRPGFAGPAYMRAAALSHLLTHHTAYPPMHTASLPLADHAEAPPGPLPDRDSGASA